MTGDEQHTLKLAAYRVYRRWRQWVDYDDVQAELYLWWLDKGQVEYGGDKWDEAHVSQAARRIAERYARTEKAAKSGYRPDDECFYTPTMIKCLIRDIVNGPLELRGAPDPEQGGRRSPVGEMRPYEYETAVVDVTRAFEALADDDRVCLTRIYGLDEPVTELAARLGITVDAVHSRATRAVRRMIRSLGGARP